MTYGGFSPYSKGFSSGFVFPNLTKGSAPAFWW